MSSSLEPAVFSLFPVGGVSRVMCLYGYALGGHIKLRALSELCRGASDKNSRVLFIAMVGCDLKTSCLQEIHFQIAEMGFSVVFLTATRLAVFFTALQVAIVCGQREY